MRRTIGALGATALALSLFTGIALAGQPGASCGADGATLKAVSQYDIACVHYTASHS